MAAIAGTAAFRWPEEKTMSSITSRARSRSALRTRSDNAASWWQKTWTSQTSAAGVIIEHGRDQWRLWPLIKNIDDSFSVVAQEAYFKTASQVHLFSPSRLTVYVVKKPFSENTHAMEKHLIELGWQLRFPFSLSGNIICKGIVASLRARQLLKEQLPSLDFWKKNIFQHRDKAASWHFC